MLRNKGQEAFQILDPCFQAGHASLLALEPRTAGDLTSMPVAPRDFMKVNYPIISADSHIAEAPNTYTDYIDPKSET